MQSLLIAGRWKWKILKSVKLSRHHNIRLSFYIVLSFFLPFWSDVSSLKSHSFFVSNFQSGSEWAPSIGIELPGELKPSFCLWIMPFEKCSVVIRDPKMLSIKGCVKDMFVPCINGFCTFAIVISLSGIPQLSGFHETWELSWAEICCPPTFTATTMCTFCPPRQSSIGNRCSLREAAGSCLAFPGEDLSVVTISWD